MVLDHCVNLPFCQTTEMYCPTFSLIDNTNPWFDKMPNRQNGLAPFFIPVCHFVSLNFAKLQKSIVQPFKSLIILICDLTKWQVDKRIWLQFSFLFAILSTCHFAKPRKFIAQPFNLLVILIRGLSKCQIDKMA